LIKNTPKKSNIVKYYENNCFLFENIFKYANAISISGHVLPCWSIWANVAHSSITSL